MEVTTNNFIEIDIDNILPWDIFLMILLWILSFSKDYCKGLKWKIGKLC